MAHLQSDAGGKALIVCEIRQSVGAKAMVITHKKRLHTVLIVKAVHEIPSGEVLHLAEIQKAHLGKALQHSHTLLQGGQHGGCLSAEYLKRVLTERVDDRLQPPGMSQGLQLLKEKAVSPMDAVKDSYGCYKTCACHPTPPIPPQ